MFTSKRKSAGEVCRDLGLRDRSPRLPKDEKIL
jgi:hypothetical protein